MTRIATAAVVCGLAGCSQCGDAPIGPDAAGAAASLQVERVSVGVSVLRSPQNLIGQTTTFLVTDPSQPDELQRVAATLDASGDQWSAVIPSGATAAAVEFTLPDPPPTKMRRKFALSSLNVQTLFAAWETPNAQTAPAAGVFSVRLTLPSAYVAQEYFVMTAAGPWASHTFAAAELPAPGTGATTIGPVNIPFTSAQFRTMVEARPLPRVTKQDRLIVQRYVGNDLTAAAIIPAFDQTGGTDVVVGALEAVPHAPLNVQVDPAAAAARYATVAPAGTSLDMSWYVVASPAWQFADSGGILLQYQGGLTAASSGMITTGYGNPFAEFGWKSLFVWRTRMPRTFTASLPVTLYTGITQHGEPIAGTFFDQQVGLPTLISINGQPLESDGKTVTLDLAQPVELSLVADRPTNAFYQWFVYELVPNTANTALELKLVYGALNSTTNVTISNDVFVAGKTYTVRGMCLEGGFPNFASGDFQTRSLPHSVGYLDSGVFTVQAL